MEFKRHITQGGFMLLRDDGNLGGIHLRWGEVIAVGNEQQDVSVGQYVMVAHGRWSRGFELNGETVRTVDPNDVLGIQDEEPEAINKATLGHATRAYEGNVSVGALEV